jgi:hypothetical protein
MHFVIMEIASVSDSESIRMNYFLFQNFTFARFWFCFFKRLKSLASIRVLAEPSLFLGSLSHFVVTVRFFSSSESMIFYAYFPILSILSVVLCEFCILTSLFAYAYVCLLVDFHCDLMCIFSD